MRPRIGSEITRPTMHRILDMREPLIPKLSPKPRQLQPPVSGPLATPATVPQTPAPAPAKPWYHRGPAPWQVVLWRSFRIGLFLGLSFVALSVNLLLPERLIAVYALGSLLFEIDSQRTFLVAVIFLLLVAVWAALGQSGQAESFAVYAFYFLVIGLMAALRELRYRRE